MRGWHRADAIRKSECGSRHLTIAQFLSSLHQKHRRRSRWVWNDELMLCEVPQCLLNIFSALAAEPTSGMYSPSFSALLTLSNSCRLRCHACRATPAEQLVQVLLRWQVRTALGKVTLARFRVLDHVENTVRSDELGHRRRRLRIGRAQRRARLRFGHAADVTASVWTDAN